MGKLIHFIKDREVDQDKIDEELEDLEVQRSELIAKKDIEVIGILARIRSIIVRKEKTAVEILQNQLNRDRRNMLCRELQGMASAWAEMKLIFRNGKFTDEDIENVIEMFKKELQFVKGKIKKTYTVPVLASLRNQELKKTLEKRGKKLVNYVKKLQKEYEEE